MNLIEKAKTKSQIVQDDICSLNLPIDFAKLIANVAYYSGVTALSIKTKTRKQEVVQARQICHYFAYILKLGGNQEIGEKIGLVDHATVIYSRKTVRNLCSYKNEVSRIVAELEEVFEI